MQLLVNLRILMKLSVQCYLLQTGEFTSLRQQILQSWPCNDFRRDTRAGNRGRERVGTLSRRWRLWQHVGVAVTHCCLARRDIPRHFASWYWEIRSLQILTLRPRDGINKPARANILLFFFFLNKFCKKVKESIAFKLIILFLERCVSDVSFDENIQFLLWKIKPMTLKISPFAHHSIIMKNHSMNALFTRPIRGCNNTLKQRGTNCLGLIYDLLFVCCQVIRGRRKVCWTYIWVFFFFFFSCSYRKFRQCTQTGFPVN